GSISCRAWPYLNISLRWCNRDDRHPSHTNRSLLDGNTHRAGGSFDLLDRAFEVNRVEVRHLELGNLADLVGSHPTGNLGIHAACALVDTSSTPQQVSSRRGLGNEREGSVLIHSDDDRNN